MSAKEVTFRVGWPVVCLTWRHPIDMMYSTHNTIKAKSVVASVRASDGQTKLFMPCPTTTVFGTTDTAYQAEENVEL